jgi:hypothetical protein
MTTTLLKKNISKVINSIEDKNFLEAVYTIVSKKEIEIQFELDEAMKQELDARKHNHKKGVSKSYSWSSVKRAALSNKE